MHMPQCALAAGVVGASSQTEFHLKMVQVPGRPAASALNVV